MSRKARRGRFREIGPIGKIKGEIRVLLDEEHADFLLTVDRAHDAENLLDHERRQSERRLVEQKQLGPHHQGAADRQHLLLAARQRARLLPATFFQFRKIAVDDLEIGGDVRPITSRMRAEAKVLLNREFLKGAPAVRYVRDAAARNIFGLAAVDPRVQKPDCAGCSYETGYGAQGGGFAGAICAQKRRYPSFLDSERKAVKHLGLAVEGADIFDFQKRRIHVACQESHAQDKR